MDITEKYILICTLNCKIIELLIDNNDIISSQLLNEGHFKDELWGLAIRPPPLNMISNYNGEFASVGDDCHLRVYSVKEKKQIYSIDMKTVARCCCYSPDGTMLAVGYGGGVGKSKMSNGGMFRIYRLNYNSENKSYSEGLPTMIFEARDAKQWITELKFSADNRLLAVGSKDNNIYVYSIAQRFKLKYKFSKHKSSITHFDLSIDGKYMQSTCNAYELLFSSLDDGKPILRGTSLMNVEWSTWTCTLGWPVQGIWPATADGTDINAVDRSPSGKLLATADDFGKVKIFRYPAVIEKSEFNVYSGHSSHVTNIRWISNLNTDNGENNNNGDNDDDNDNNLDAYLISAGGNDKCLFQWKNTTHIEDFQSTSSIRNKLLKTRNDNDNDNNEYKVFKEDDLEAPSGGDEFMAIKPWKGAIKAPSNFGVPDPTRVVQFHAALGNFSNQQALLHSYNNVPQSRQIYDQVSIAAEQVFDKLIDSGFSSRDIPDTDEIELSWVNGYRGFDCRNNVRYGCNGQVIIYYTANLGIVLSKDQPKQLYFRGHTDDIISIATYESSSSSSSSSSIEETQVVSGQRGKANTFVWTVTKNSITLNSTFQTGQKSINMLQFSQDGRLIISIAEDYTVAITEWKNQRVIANVAGEPAPTYDLCAGDMNKLFLSCGEKYIRVWSLSGRNLTSVKISTSGKGKPQKFWSSTFFAGQWIVGCDDGSIYVIPIDSNQVTRLLSDSSSETSSSSSSSETAAGSSTLTSLSTTNPSQASSKMNAKTIKSSSSNNSKNQKVKKISTPSKSSSNNKTISTTSAPKSTATGAAAVNSTTTTKTTTITNSAITSLCVSNSGSLLIAGSKNGNISLYSVKSLLATISIQSIFSDIQFLGLQIQSLCCRENEGLIDLLISTRGCDIIEIKRESSDSWDFIPGDKSPLVQGHFNDELWGLATHPFLPEYITVGDDKTLRRWILHPIDNRVNRMISCLPLGIMSRACEYHPSGNFIAVGFGGRVGRGKQKDDGVLRIYSYPNENSRNNNNSNNNSSNNTMLKLCEMKDAKQWISDVKFSPDGTILAVGSHDNIIFLYSVNYEQLNNVTLQLTGKFSKHNSYITHLDFSSDSRFIQSNCGAYELLFSDASTKRQITSASELRDVRWSTWTCTLGWPVQGIWPTGADGTDINAVDRSHSGHLIATSDDFGKVKIFRYPCVTEGADSLICSGHSSHVMNVRWTVGDEYLMSCGGNDKSIFQWKHIILSTDTSSSKSNNIHNNNNNGNNNSGNSSSGNNNNTQLLNEFNEDDSYNNNNSDMGEISGGDEFMAVKPWKGAIRAPENPPSINSSVPSTNLTLSWVHGYTSGSAGSNDSRISSNLFYNLNGDIIYPAAALGVCLHYNVEEPENKTQKYFQGHNDDILCLTISSCKRYVATGQTASKNSKGKGSICIWDAVDCRMLSEMNGCHQRGVISLSFNPEGDKLISVGLDDSYQHILWSDIGGSWSRVQQVKVEKSDQKTHLYTRWIPSIAESESNFVSGGATSIHFWKIEGSALTRKESRTGKYKQKPILCAANLRMKDRFRLISGTSSGDLYVFEHDSRECKNSIENAHDGAILTLAEGEDYQFLISGGMDKCVKIWNQALQPITFYKFEQNPVISPVNASVASLDYRLDSRRNIIVLVGTVGGEIIEISADTEQSLKGSSLSSNNNNSNSLNNNSNINFDLMKSTVTVLLQSHYSGELWGIAPHPQNPDLILSVGDDGTIRLWSISRSEMISCIVVGKPMRSVCWNSNGNFFAVGFFQTNKGGNSNNKSNSSTTSSKSNANNTNKKSSKSNTNSSSNDTNITLGSCAIYKYNESNNSITFISTGCSSTAWISDIKFSSHDAYLALGSHDKKLYVYNVPSNIESTEDWKNTFKKPRYTFNKHSSAILHFDFTEDENYFQTNCQAYELLFGDAKTGLQKTSATELSRYNGQLNDPNEQWSTWTCTLGWPVQGIWPTGADGSDINAVDRSHQMNLIASADDLGLVKLFRYPCVEEGSKFKTYTGHSSHVTCVRWNSNDNYLISSGGNDKCLFIWKVLS